MSRLVNELKYKIKYNLILKNEYIRARYWEYYAENPGMELLSKLKRIKKTILLNLEYKINKKDIQENKGVLPVNELINKLEEYDIVSFDIFDTLVLRILEQPVDVFSYIEAEYDFPHFCDLRIKAEKKARMISETGEVNLREIYEVLATGTGIDIETWISREIEAEMLICKANPYFTKVVDELKYKNIKMIVVSDMYLENSVIERLLVKCGYYAFEKVFVSNEYGVSKGNGKLYEKIKQYSNGRKIIHIGDNLESDFVNARKAGIEAWHYPNVNESYGIKNLHFGMSRLTGSVTKGILNSYLRCGKYEHNEYFKFGMINGGLLTCGYCEYINKVVQEQKVNKILFLARDGYIVKRVYDAHYKLCDTEYTLFSRFCSEQILFEKYTEDYINHNIRYRYDLERKVTLEQLLKEIDLEFLLDKLSVYDLNNEDILTRGIGDKVVSLIYGEKSKICEYFSTTQKRMYEYLKPIIEGCSCLLAVDLGWFGTGGLALKYLLEDKYQSGVKVLSALVGTNEDTSLEGRIVNQTLFPYAYSPVHDVYLLHWHTRHQYNIHNLLIELMFSAPYPSFLKFNINDKSELEPLFSYEEKENYDIINSIHDGILTFADMYTSLDESLKKLLQINGGDAYAAFMSSADNQRLCFELFKDYKISQLSGIFGEKSITRLGDIMREDHYI